MSIPGPGHPTAAPPPWNRPPQVAPRPTPRPGVVTASFWLWIVVALVGVVAALVRWEAFPSRAAAAPYTQPSLLIALVSAVIGAALYVTFAVFMYRRHNWARITLTVIAAVGLLAGGIGLAATAMTRLGSTTTIVFTVVQFLIVLTALVLFYFPSANAWFSACSPSCPGVPERVSGRWV